MPVTARMRARAWEPDTESGPSWSHVQPHWMFDGRFMAYILAASRILSAGSQVMGSAHSGVYCAMWSNSSSKPSHQVVTKLKSIMPSYMMVCSMASASAVSEPGRSGSHKSAFAAVSE